MYYSNENFGNFYVRYKAEGLVLFNLAWCSLVLGYLKDADEYAHICLEYAKDEKNQDIMKACGEVIQKLTELNAEFASKFGKPQ